MMDKKLLYKLVTIVVLSIMLFVPLAMIEGQISQRGNRLVEVQNNIAESAAGSQTLVGPVLAIRYQQVVQENVIDPKTNISTTREQKINRTLILPATKLDIQGTTEVEVRSRGIYQTRLYHLDLNLQGKAIIPPHLGMDAQRTQIGNAQAVLLLGISDPRGITELPKVNINGREYSLTTPTNNAHYEEMPGNQLQVNLGPVNLQTGNLFNFNSQLKLTGTGTFSVAPTAEENTVTLAAPWPHPSFQGRFLPITRTITDNSFEAKWAISHLARNFDHALGANNGRTNEVLSVSFMDPVNVYLQSERAVKYGGLFIILTFAAFFLGEILRRRPMHPMQYLLVGLALALFFLLLIALSEHIPFIYAYLASALACIGLITIYLSGALGGYRPALAFGAGFTGLYGVLYGLLQSEDNSLLMGTVLLFIALGATMLTTRRLNWYKLGVNSTPDESNQP